MSALHIISITHHQQVRLYHGYERTRSALAASKTRGTALLHHLEGFKEGTRVAPRKQPVARALFQRMYGSEMTARPKMKNKMLITREQAHRGPVTFLAVRYATDTERCRQNANGISVESQYQPLQPSRLRRRRFKRVSALNLR